MGYFVFLDGKNDEISKDIQSFEWEHFPSFDFTQIIVFILLFK